jgi:hypothetical protein
MTMTMKPDRRTLSELFTLLREQFAVEVRTNIPGIVKGYGVFEGRPVCDVQLGPRQILADGTDDELPLVERVPIGYLVMGSLTIRAPLEVGQGVDCRVSDRQLDKFLTQGQSTYRPTIGSIHDENDIIAYPTIQPNAKEPTVAMNPAELYIGDHTGAATHIRMNTRTGEIRVETTALIELKCIGPVNVESPAVTLGSIGSVASIARVGTDFVLLPIIPPGGIPTATPLPILPGPLALPVPSAHKVKG